MLAESPTFPVALAAWLVLFVGVGITAAWLYYLYR